MTLCVVCSNVGAKPRHTAGGTCYGATCDGQCEAVAWDAHWQRATRNSTHELDAMHRDYEAKLLRWEWRRQAAVARGLPFSEKPPKSPGEEKIDSWIHRNGLEDVAKELE
jgi:hypothetical protein